MSTPHQSRHTLFFRRDEVVEAARKRPGWRDFHRVCGQHGIYFDDIESAGKRQGYRAIAFELDDSTPKQWVNPVEGRGNDPAAAVADAYRKQGRGNPETDAALEVMLRGEEIAAVMDTPEVQAAIVNAVFAASIQTAPDPMDDLLGIAADEDEDLIG